MKCDKCGNELFLDKKSVADLNVIGCVGGRFYCITGCTSIWLKRHVPTTDISIEIDEQEIKQELGVPIRKRDYATKQFREIVCQRCKRRVRTLGNNAKYCLTCGIIAKRQNDREYERKRRLKILAE